MYRVIKDNKVYPFDSYGEAINFKWTNGGILYVKVYGD